MQHLEDKTAFCQLHMPKVLRLGPSRFITVAGSRLPRFQGLEIESQQSPRARNRRETFIKTTQFC